MAAADVTPSACSICRWWAPTDDPRDFEDHVGESLAGLGACHAGPPLPVVIRRQHPATVTTRFPITSGEEWCGLHAVQPDLPHPPEAET